MEQRLQKLLAAAGIASRRSCEDLIAAGRVTVNGQKVTQPGTRADVDLDDVRVDGKRVHATVEHVYLVLNKPTGYVTTVKDPHAPRTVMSLLKGVQTRVFPVGRLDSDSAGLLLFTNDGDFAQTLTHPSHQVAKTYRTVVRGEVPAWAAADLRKGIILEDGMTAPAGVEWIDYDEANNASIIEITLHEGRNRQVRRMFEAVGYPVLALTRMRIGPIELKGIAPGTWRKLTPAEVRSLLDSADVGPPSLPQQPLDEPVPALRSSASTANPGRSHKSARNAGTGPKLPSPPSANRAGSNPNRGKEIQAAADTLWRKLKNLPDEAGQDSGPPPRPGPRSGPRGKKR